MTNECDTTSKRQKLSLSIKTEHQSYLENARHMYTGKGLDGRESCFSYGEKQKNWVTGLANSSPVPTLMCKNFISELFRKLSRRESHLS